MIGFVFGAGRLVGLAALLHGGWHARRWRRGFHADPCRRWHHRGPRSWLFVLSEELDLTPGQEKAVRAAADRFFDTVHPLRSELRHTRDDVAKALLSEPFDATLPAGVFARHDDALAKLRSAVVQLLQSVHEVLDARQRERSASWVESHHAPPWSHPYRTPAC